MKTVPVNEVKAVIFDLDGTLIDTEKIYREVWPKTIRQLGYVMTDEMYLAMRSLGRPYAPERLKGWYGEDFDYEAARGLRTRLFNEVIERDGIHRMPGAIELLTYLKSKGIVTAIATATDSARALDYMRRTGIDSYFDRVISACSVPCGKPSPMVYEYACSELGFSPSECIAVEDAPNGIRSAHDAGMRVIMVPDQSEPEPELLPLLFECVDNLTCIKNIIV